MLRMSCVVVFFLLHAVCIDAFCSDSSHCPSCLGGMQSVCFRRECKCFAKEIPNECHKASECDSICLAGTIASCPDGKCHCTLQIG